MKSGELSGAILQPKVFEKYIDSMARALKAFGGTVTPHDYMMVMRGGKGAALNWSPEFIETVLPTLIQEKGTGVGNDLFQVYSAIVGGRMLQQNARHFDDLGLIDHSSLDPKTAFTAEGRLKKATAGSIISHELAAADPFEWMHQVLLPQMVAKGRLSQQQLDAVKAGNIREGIGHEGMQTITKEFTNLFGRQTAQAVADIMALQYKKIMRDKKLIADAFGLDQGVEYAQGENYKTNMVALHAQWENLMETLGAPGVGAAVRALRLINGAISSLVEKARLNPTAVKVFLATLTGLAVGITVAFTLVAGLAIAGFIGTVGLVIAGVSGIAAAIAALAFLKWNDVRVGLSAIWTVAKQIAGEFISAIASIPGQIAGAVTAMAAAIAARISSALGNIFGSLRSLLGVAPGAGDGVASPKGIQKQSYVPPPSGGNGPKVVRTALVMDGRILGEAVAQFIARNGQHMGGSADFDGMQAAMPVDFSPA